VGIAIIGAVLAVSIPMVISAKNKSENEKRLANVRTLTDANWRARILGMSDPAITTNTWQDGRPGGCNANDALAFYNQHGLLGTANEIDLTGLVFSNAIWGTTNDPSEHFNPPDSKPSATVSPTPTASPSPKDPWDIFKDLPPIDGSDIDDYFSDINGRVRIWDFADNKGNTWQTGVGTWDPTTGKSNSGAGRTGDEPSGGWSGGWGSGFVSGNTGAGESDYSGGTTYDQTSCGSNTTVTVRIKLNPGPGGGRVVSGGQEPYTVGQMYPVAAVPAEGWKFDRWILRAPQGTATSTFPAAMVPLVDCDLEVEAVFLPDPNGQIKFAANAGGTLNIVGTKYIGSQAMPLNITQTGYQDRSREGQQWAVMPKPDTTQGYLFDRWTGPGSYPPLFNYSINSSTGLLSATGYRPGFTVGFDAHFRKVGVTNPVDNCPFKVVAGKIFIDDGTTVVQRGGETGEIAGTGVRTKSSNGFYGYIEALPNPDASVRFGYWQIEYVDPVTQQDRTTTSTATKFNLDSLNACSIVAKAFFRPHIPSPSPSPSPDTYTALKLVSEPAGSVGWHFTPGPSSVLPDLGWFTYYKGPSVISVVAKPGRRVTALTLSNENGGRVIGRLSESQWYIESGDGLNTITATTTNDPDASGYIGTLSIYARTEGGRGEQVSVEVLGQDYNIPVAWFDPSRGIAIQPGDILTVRVNHRQGGWIRNISISDGRIVKVQPVSADTYRVHITADTPYGEGFGGDRDAIGNYWITFVVGFGGPYINPNPSPTPDLSLCSNPVRIAKTLGGIVTLVNSSGATLQSLDNPEANEGFITATELGQSYTAKAVAAPGWRFDKWRLVYGSGFQYTFDRNDLILVPQASRGNWCESGLPQNNHTAEYLATFVPDNTCPDAYALSNLGDANGLYVKHGESKLPYARTGEPGSPQFSEYIIRPTWVRADGQFRIFFNQPYGSGSYRWELQSKINGRWSTWINNGSAGSTGETLGGPPHTYTLPPDCPDIRNGTLTPADRGDTPTPTPGKFDDFGVLSISGRDGAWVSWQVYTELPPGADASSMPAEPRAGFIPPGGSTDIFIKSNQRVRLTAYTGSGTQTTITEYPWSLYYEHNASYIGAKPYSLTLGVKPRETLAVVARGSGGPDSSPSASPSASATASPSASPFQPWGFGVAYISLPHGQSDGGNPRISPSDFHITHGQASAIAPIHEFWNNHMHWSIDRTGWTGGVNDRPGPEQGYEYKWPIIIRVNHPNFVWGDIPNAVYSSDYRTISVPKPKLGQTLNLNLVKNYTKPPDTTDYGWIRHVIKSKVSEDPWWFEIKTDYNGKTVGIVGADSPLVLRQPPDGANWGEYSLARSYPGVQFEFYGDRTPRIPWERKPGSTSADDAFITVGTLVKGGASPTPSPSPVGPLTPDDIPVLCVSGSMDGDMVDGTYARSNNTLGTGPGLVWTKQDGSGVYQAYIYYDAAAALYKMVRTTSRSTIPVAWNSVLAGQWQSTATKKPSVIIGSCNGNETGSTSPSPEPPATREVQLLISPLDAGYFHENISTVTGVEGETKSIIARPKEGWRFDRFVFDLVGSSVTTGGVNGEALIFSMPKSGTVTARFVLDTGVGPTPAGTPSGSPGGPTGPIFTTEIDEILTTLEGVKRQSPWYEWSGHPLRPLYDEIVSWYGSGKWRWESSPWKIRDGLSGPGTLGFGGRYLVGPKVNFAGLPLVGIDFRGVDLRGAVLKGADLRGTDLSGAILDLFVDLGPTTQIDVTTKLPDGWKHVSNEYDSYIIKNDLPKYFVAGPAWIPSSAYWHETDMVSNRTARAWGGRGTIQYYWYSGCGDCSQIYLDEASNKFVFSSFGGTWTKDFSHVITPHGWNWTTRDGVDKGIVSLNFGNGGYSYLAQPVSENSGNPLFDSGRFWLQGSQHIGSDMINKKFGAGAGLWDKNIDFLIAGAGAGSGEDFTIEAWVNPDYKGRLNTNTSDPAVSGVVGNSMALFGHAAGNANNNWSGPWRAVVDADGVISLWAGTDTSTAKSFLRSSGRIESGEWSHVAVSKVGQQWRVYINGRLVGTHTITGDEGLLWTEYSNGVTFGSSINYAPSEHTPKWFRGRMDELRYTSGAARYTGSWFPLQAEPYNHDNETLEKWRTIYFNMD